MADCAISTNSSCFCGGYLIKWRGNIFRKPLKTNFKSEIQAFCNGLKKDIAPVKNAISLSISSGFVEGNNNKFKALKRIVYGRSRLVNLEKKCKLAFLPKRQDFCLSALL